ncbi:hypothetical protein K439DRAFT_1613268 [Ramaria rubella]|nr:hypothetical protein K439DRAFT_1613268 [Ramaria rubella]
MLNPLFEAGHKGVTMTCTNGGIQHVLPLLAAYVVDFPENVLIACCQENWCPQCMCPPQVHGDPLDTFFSECAEPIYWEPEIHLKHVCADADDAREDKGIRAVTNPFWEGLPHCDIFHCFTPDILHQLHKGMVKDHLCLCCMSLATKPEPDAQFQAMPSHPSLHHFKKGISTISQWSGMEYKNMENIFVGLISGAIPSEALHAARALLDFIYLAQYTSHSTTTLEWLQEALNQFHTHKDIFIQKDVRLHFQILKIHSL